MADQRLWEDKRLADELPAVQLLSVQSAWYGSLNGIKSIQIHRGDHAVVTVPFIAHSDGHAVVLVVGVKEREAKAMMEGH